MDTSNLLEFSVGLKSKLNKWVLIVDDEEPIRKSIKEALEEAFPKKLRIVEARDGLEADKKLKNQNFHLVITDIRMPRKDGEELIEAIRDKGFNQTTPIIAISGYETVDIEKKYAFVSFLEKPLDMDKLTKMVETSFKLESTEKMVEASIFSSLLDCSLRFLKEALKREDFEVGEMKLKKKGEVVETEHAAVIRVEVGGVSNTFSVLSSKKTLEELRDHSPNIEGKSVDVICRSLGFVILKNVLVECGIIDSNEVHVRDVTEDPTILSDKQGILVPINAKDIDYKIFATTNTVEKKAS